MFKLLYIALAISFAACGSDSDNDHSNHDHSNHDHSGDKKSDASGPEDADYSTTKKTDKGTYTVSYTVSSEDSKIPLNEIFNLTAMIDPSSADATVTIDAAMPDHKHGMNVKPELSSSVSGEKVKAEAKGMKFHMPGYWEIYVTIGSGETEEKATFSVMVNAADDEASK